jgi:hypothetical protein
MIQFNPKSSYGKLALQPLQQLLRVLRLILTSVLTTGSLKTLNILAEVRKVASQKRAGFKVTSIKVTVVSVFSHWHARDGS